MQNIIAPCSSPSPMCIELISAVKHLKGSEVVPRGLFQGFLQNRKSKKERWGDSSKTRKKEMLQLIPQK